MVARERCEERRAAFLTAIQPYLGEPERLIYVDESGFHTAMSRSYARARSHERAVGVLPRNHGRVHTLICALSMAGPLAPLMLDGPVNGASFEFWVAQELCPVLQAGQVVVMDKLSSHHRASIRTLVEQQGCTLMYLPPYSPDFNPIEWLFSQVKARVRAAGRRSVEGMMESVGKALEGVSRVQLRQWFVHATLQHLL